MQRRRFLQSIIGLGVTASVGGFIDFDSPDSPDTVRGRGVVADCIIFDELESIDKEIYTEWYASVLKNGWLDLGSHPGGL